MGRYYTGGNTRNEGWITREYFSVCPLKKSLEDSDDAESPLGSRLSKHAKDGHNECDYFSWKQFTFA